MEGRVVEVQDAWRDGALVDDAKYREMYQASVTDPDAFWSEHGKRIDWMTPYTRVKNTSFEPGNVSIKWFEDGKTNVAYNCVDRHLETRGEQTAIIWEGDNPDESKHITYRELHAQVCRWANVLRNRGVEKGDRVTLYLPMVPEAAYAMLACARLGRSTPSCSAASRRIPWPSASRAAARSSSSPPTRACAAAARCR